MFVIIKRSGFQGREFRNIHGYFMGYFKAKDPQLAKEKKLGKHHFSKCYIILP